MKRNMFKRLSLSATMFCSANLMYAQVSITGTGSAYSQNFDGLLSSGSSSWSDNSTLSNWYADKSGSGTLTIAADNGSLSTVSLYSYGATSSSDRALGALPGTTGNGNLMIGLRMKNNSGATIKSMTVSYVVEQWRVNGTSAQPIEFYYKTSSGTVTGFGGSWTQVNELGYSSPQTGSDGAVNGNSSANRVTVSYTMYNLNLSSGHEIMLQWYFPNSSGGSTSLAVDDVSIEVANPTVYYSKSTGNLNLTSTWGTSTNGSGTNPSNFTANDVLYIIANNSAPTIGATWTVSGTNSKVILGTGSSINFTIPSTFCMNGTIDLSDNATLTLNHTTLPTISNMASSSSIALGASGLSLPAGTYYTLTVSGGGTKSLGGDISVKNSLVFSSGKLSLGSYNITMPSTATISSASSSNYLVAEGSGTLIRRVLNNATSVSFPVGTSTSYVPVSLSQSATGTSDNFKVRVLANMYDAYNSSDAATGSQVSSDAVNMTWIVSEETAGGSSLDITLQWNASDEGASFTRSSCRVWHYQSGSFGTGTYAAASGAGPYTRAITGVSSFSPFGLMDNTSALPVEWSYLAVDVLPDANMVKWVTATEKNNKGFIVERMQEASGEFAEVGFVEGAGNSENERSYSFMDAYWGTKAYYRIRQVDFNGQEHYSKILLAERKDEKSLSFYPNPVQGQLVLQSGDAELSGSSIKLYDSFGKEYEVPTRQLSQNRIQLDVSTLKRGVYLLSWTAHNQLNTKKILMN